MKIPFLIFIAGGAGTVCRYFLSEISFIKNKNFPIATLSINVLGCLLIGIIMAYSLRNINFENNNIKLFLATGFCGGFTTFSAFTNETFLLIKNNNIAGACIYILASIVLGLLATFIGYKLI
jgi:fluoride exporter